MAQMNSIDDKLNALSQEGIGSFYGFKGEKWMMWDEILVGETVDFLLGGIQKKIKEVKANFEWKKLFLDTGLFLVYSPDKLKSFEDDLFVVFSKENMKEISEKLQDKRGYEFPELLHDELYDLMIRYEISPVEAESYIHHFSQVIINYLESSNSGKFLELYLGEWKREEEKYFADIESKLDLILKRISDLKKIEVSSLSITDIDVLIRKESLYKGMGLSFFEIDDDQFEANLQTMIDNERIFIVGKSREETTYRILNELKTKNSERVTLIIKSEEEWRKLDKVKLSGNILIPFFYAESIVAIPDNTNIFIFGEDEPCYSRDKLELRKRTKKNIIDSLEKIGLDANEAYNTVDNTHGLFVPMKKKLFNGAIYNRPEWVETRSDTVMAALLCGKWTESDGDILIFEEISGKKYSECKKEMESYAYGENPFIVQINGYSGRNLQLASVEDAWEEMDIYITDKMWDNFIKLFYEVLIESEPIFKYPFEKHFEASIYAKKPEWSPTLKYGMIRSLIMRAYYRKHDENQRQIDSIIEKVLETITTKERWGYISQYITDLCEASPKAVMLKLENEFTNPTGLVELFEANDNDIITSRNYYTHILWAIEQLLQQKAYVLRAIEWLWKMNSYEIKYSMSNSPKSVLEVVFCAWINVSVLTVENKIILAEKAVQEYSNAWEIIYSEFPGGIGTICSTFSSPKYRRVDEPNDLYVTEVNKTYIEYLKICVNAIKTDASKWMKIIERLHSYYESIHDEVLGKLVEECMLMSDQNKIQIKNEIRHLVYKHRYFINAEWSMTEEQIKKYEESLDKIVLNDPVYDYLYLFTSSYDFPLLHPIPFDKETSRADLRNDNGLLREKEIETKMKIFKDEQYSLEKLIELSIKNEKSILGEVIAQYYCYEVFDESVFNLLLEKDKEGKHVFDYVRSLIRNSDVDLKHILEIVKKSTHNENLVVNLISLEIIEDYKKSIIANESIEIKRAYWSRNFNYRILEKAKVEVYLWALDECCKYGTINTYLELLFDMKDEISDIQLYQRIFSIMEMKCDVIDSMTEYYLEEILKIIQKSFQDDLDKCQKIASLEWMCRNVLNWEQMKCMQYMMKMDPTIYADLVRIIYKSNDNEEKNEEKKDLVNKIYGGFSKAKFCPTEKDGKVEYQAIKEWVDKFKKLLIVQKQDGLFDSLLGSLLVYSPIGEDGYMPCEAVRRIIEEYYSESLKTSYEVAEENKRGVHTVDAGKSEMKLHQRYKKNAEELQDKYPRTAEIYFALSDSYKKQADWERRCAEDEL